jgi:hypothetical protein
MLISKLIGIVMLLKQLEKKVRAIPAQLGTWRSVCLLFSYIWRNKQESPRVKYT